MLAGRDPWPHDRSPATRTEWPRGRETWSAPGTTKLDPPGLEPAQAECVSWEHQVRRQLCTRQHIPTLGPHTPPLHLKPTFFYLISANLPTRDHHTFLHLTFSESFSRTRHFLTF